MKILVTGSSGFLGSNLINFLTKKKIKFVGIDKKNNKYLKFKNFYKLDLAQNSKLENIIKKEKITHIVHLAALSGIDSCHNDIKLAYRSNLTSLINVLDISNRLLIERVVIISSFSVNDFIDNPSIYGATKIANENIGFVFNKIFKTNVTTLKLANIYGPFSSHKNSAIHKFVRQNLKNMNYSVHNKGSQRRDFVFVLDVVKIILTLIKSKKRIENINVSTGKTTSIMEVCNLINSLTSNSIKSKFTKTPIGLISNKRKKAKLKNFKFDYTNLRNGIAKTIDWYKKK